MTKEQFNLDVKNHVSKPITKVELERFLAELNKIDPLGNKCVYLREAILKDLNKE